MSMTPERLAEIERLADEGGHGPSGCKLWYDGCHCFEVGLADAIAHIRDLEAQVRELSDFKEQFIDKEVKWLTAQAKWIAERGDLEAQLAEARKFLKDTHTSLTTALIQVERYQWLLDERATATATPPSLSAKERQRRSFAYGNVHIDNPNVTREMMDRVAERLASKPPSPEVK